MVKLLKRRPHGILESVCFLHMKWFLAYDTRIGIGKKETSKFKTRHCFSSSRFARVRYCDQVTLPSGSIPRKG